MFHSFVCCLLAFIIVLLSVAILGRTQLSAVETQHTTRYLVKALIRIDTTS